jgi:hypothetical protein
MNNSEISDFLIRYIQPTQQAEYLINQFKLNQENKYDC